MQCARVFLRLVPSLIGKETEADVTSPSPHSQCDMGLEYKPKLSNKQPSLLTSALHAEGTGACVLLLEAPNKMSPCKHQERSN